VAAADAGGRLVFFTGQFSDTDWAAQHLIDGTPDSGWAAPSKGPQAVILAFAGDGLAELEDVVVNPYTRENSSNWVSRVEIYVSTTYPFRDYRHAGDLDLEPEGTFQVFSFPEPTPVRYLKIRFAANRGGGYMEAGEVQAMGRLLTGAPPPPAYEEPWRSARLESYSSQFNDTDWAAANLLADCGARGQWAGRNAEAQEVVIALAEPAAITDVAVNNTSREDPKNWAREVEVQVSTTAAYKGFATVGKLSMPPVGDLHTLTLAEPAAASYVKLIFRSNHGGGYMEAARIRLYRVEDAAGPPGAGAATLARQLEDTGRAVVHAIHFAFNSAEILPESTPTLREIADLLRGQADLELIIEGHTDNVGGAEHNLELSRQRAEAVKRWLVDEGGAGEIRLTTVGYGLGRPIADNATEEGRARNRRVELVRR
jgi:outer membrane protein OmpA-like peptidoglycan-associated protein